MIGDVLFFAERFEERLHIFSVFLLISHNSFHHGARGGIVIAKVAEDFVVGLDGDPPSHQVFPNHLEQRCAFDILRMAASGEPFRIKVRRTSQLDNTLSRQVSVTLLLRLRVPETPGLPAVRESQTPYNSAVCSAARRQVQSPELRLTPG